MTSYSTILGDGGHSTGGNYTTNRYSNVGLGRCPFLGGSDFAVEADVQQRIRVSGTVSDLRWGLDQPFSTSPTGPTLILTLRQNSAGTNLKVCFPPGVTGWMADTNTADNVVVSPGDWLDFEADVGTGNSGYTGDLNCVSACFTAATGSAQMFATVGPDSIAVPNGEVYASFLGILTLRPESDVQFLALTSGTWQYLACHVDTNSFNGNTTIISRLNGGDGNMTIVIPSSIPPDTGNFEDVTHTDCVCADDLLDYGLSTAATVGKLVMDWIGCHYFATTETNCMIGGVPGSLQEIAYNETRYESLFGGGETDTTTTRATGAFPYAATLKNYSNHIGGHGTCTLIINGSTSNLSVSRSHGQTGWLTDSSDTVGVLEGDCCSNMLAGDKNMSSSSLKWEGAGLLVVAAAASGT